MILFAFLSGAAAKKTKILFPVQAHFNFSPGLQRKTQSMFAQKLSLSLKKDPRPASQHNWGQLLLGGELGPVFVQRHIGSPLKD